jgi:hypothetical protein
MEQQIAANAPGHFPAPRHKLSTPPEPDLSAPPRGGEPKSIGQLLEPIQTIIRHPDRNRLMAGLFKRYW